MSTFRMLADVGYVVGPIVLGVVTDVFGADAALHSRPAAKSLTRPGQQSINRPAAVAFNSPPDKTSLPWHRD